MLFSSTGEVYIHCQCMYLCIECFILTMSYCRQGYCNRAKGQWCYIAENVNGRKVDAQTVCPDSVRSSVHTGRRDPYKMICRCRNKNYLGFGQRLLVKHPHQRLPHLQSPTESPWRLARLWGMVSVSTHAGTRGAAPLSGWSTCLKSVNKLKQMENGI